MEFCKELDYIDENTSQLWFTEYQQICKMLNKLKHNL
ncbi:MAG: hypothetical protein ACPGRX_01625 [Bdellovibrionales bacterium]